MSRRDDRELALHFDCSNLSLRFASFPETFVYVAAVTGTVSPVKIGRSRDVISRLRGIQTSAPLTLIASAPEWAISEKELHVRFSHLRAHGEWFNLSDELSDLISQLPRLTAAVEKLRARILSVLGLDERGNEVAKDSHPLAHLIATEERLECLRRRRIRKEEIAGRRAFRAMMQELGCGICGRRHAPLFEGGLPRWICAACRRWVKLALLHPTGLVEVAAARMVEIETEHLTELAESAWLRSEGKIQAVRALYEQRIQGYRSLVVEMMASERKV